MVAGADAEQLAALDAYGRRLGLAFQITDDLLDVAEQRGSHGQTGRQGRRTGKTHVSRAFSVLTEAPNMLDNWSRRRVQALEPLRRSSRGASSRRPICPGKESLMDELLSTINSPQDLKKLSQQQLAQLAAEMRQALCRLASTRTAHFASNLGVVELALGPAHHVRFHLATA